MHLSARKLRIESTFNQHNYENAISLSIDNRLPFVRPCAIIKMCGGYESYGRPHTTSTTHFTQPANVMSTSNDNCTARGSNKTHTPQTHQNIARYFL